VPDKPCLFIGSSLDDLREFPADVRGDIGHALREAQRGGEALAAKALKGFGGRGVLEIVENFEGETYRAVYTVKFAGAVYVLHAFEKKSKKGISTPKQEIELIKRRLRLAEDDHRVRFGPGGPGE
jgi:phage-related protein